eukprot:1281179-Pleurochrysis_carterae.AAC.1
MRPITSITDHTSELGWRVRLCQTPEIGRPLPAVTRDLKVAVARDPRYNQDTIFVTFAMRFLTGDEYIADYTANAENYWSTSPSIYHLTEVMWIEIWKDDHRGVIPVRMLWNTNRSAPEASLLGVRLTEDTYR